MVTLNVNGITAKFANVYSDDNKRVYYANDNTGNAPTSRFFDNKPFSLSGEVDGVKYYVNLNEGVSLVSGKAFDATKIGSNGGRKAAAIDAAYIAKLWATRIAKGLDVLTAAITIGAPGVDADKAAAANNAAVKAQAAADDAIIKAQAAADDAADKAAKLSAAIASGDADKAAKLATAATKAQAAATKAQADADKAQADADDAADKAAAFINDAIAAINNDNAAAFLFELIK